MTWTRLDDTWTDLPELADLPHDVRWHYLCMIQFCSRTKRYDGILKTADARRCSDVDDPVGAMSTLFGADLIHPLPEGQIKVGRIEDHIPPPSVREASEKTAIRMRRSRAHKNGDHSLCLPDNCKHLSVDSHTGEVTGSVTRNTRTGQDGTGRLVREGVTKKNSNENFSSDPFSSEPCLSCGRPIAGYQSGMTHCQDCTSPKLTEPRVSPDADGITPSRPAIAPNGGATVAHRAPAVHTSCAFAGCVDASRPGKQMCQMHFTHEPSSSAA